MAQLSEANLQAHQRVVGNAAPLSVVSSASVIASSGGSRFGRRPEDSMGSIIGFGGKSAANSRPQTREWDAASQQQSASSRTVAVGHGSVRPPSTAGRDACSDIGAAEDVLLESLQVQLEEERRNRQAMESRLKQLESLLTSSGGSRPTSAACASAPPGPSGLKSRRPPTPAAATAAPKAAAIHVKGEPQRMDSGRPPRCR